MSVVTWNGAWALMAAIAWSAIGPADEQLPECNGCDVGASSKEASTTDGEGRTVRITVDFTKGGCSSAIGIPEGWHCEANPCTAEVTNQWSGFEGGEEGSTCYAVIAPDGSHRLEHCDDVDVDESSGESIELRDLVCSLHPYVFTFTVDGVVASTEGTCSTCITSWPPGGAGGGGG